MVKVLGATQVGILSMSQFQKSWQGASSKERPAALYRCPSSRFSCCGDSGLGQSWKYIETT